MRAVFGVVSLLVVLAFVGFTLSRQLRATGLAGRGAAASAAVSNQQAAKVQQQVAEDITKALEQGAAARKDEAEKAEK